MRYHRHALIGAINPFLELRTNGPLVLGEEEAEAFNELDAATRDEVAEMAHKGADAVCARIREVIA
ncbi:hypothetical protein [Paraburkholderia phenoliruptrix]|uniref:hypothetical protein n=1 Tax=Paraburkholderia phenoliruptrix TaxID=252970 RepID=UPI0034CDF4C3